MEALCKYLWTYLSRLSVPWHFWLGGRKGIRPVKKLYGEVLVWLSVWSEVQTWIWPSWCHCHLLFLASVKSRLVFTFLVLAHPGSPGKRAVKWVFVCVESSFTRKLHYSLVILFGWLCLIRWCASAKTKDADNVYFFCQTRSLLCHVACLYGAQFIHSELLFNRHYHRYLLKLWSVADDFLYLPTWVPYSVFFWITHLAFSFGSTHTHTPI